MKENQWQRDNQCWSYESVDERFTLLIEIDCYEREEQDNRKPWENIDIDVVIPSDERLYERLHCWDHNRITKSPSRENICCISEDFYSSIIDHIDHRKVPVSKSIVSVRWEICDEIERSNDERDQEQS